MQGDLAVVDESVERSVRARGVRLFCALLVAAIFAPVLVASPVAAAVPGEPSVSESGQLSVGLLQPPDLAVESVAGFAAQVDEQAGPVEAASERGRRRGWDSDSDRTDTGRGRKIRVGDSPVSVDLSSADAELAAEVAVNVLPEEFAGQLSPLDSAVAVGFRTRAGAPVLPRDPFEIELDLGDVPYEDSGDLVERLTVSVYEGCELFEPELTADDIDAGVSVDDLEDVVVCDAVTELPADFDTETEVLSADIDLDEVRVSRAEERRERVAAGLETNPKSGMRRSGRNADGVLSPEGPIRDGGGRDQGRQAGGPRGQSVVFDASAVSAGVLALFQAGTGGDQVIGVSTSASSSSGDYSALPVPTLTDTQVGLYTGAAEVTYPIPVPPAAAGPAPSVSLNYSSASVDGMTFATNNQTGPIGTGWSLSAGGSIQRQLKACNDPGAALGDRCISSAPDDVYTLNLAGRSSRLVFVEAGTVGGDDFREFRLENDPFWRVRLWTGTSQGLTVDTEDAFNHWWSVETPDGTEYRLGTTDQSMDWLPVWYPTPAPNPCGNTYRLCNTARQWNLDTVTDAFGNQMQFEYGQEHNNYNARALGTNNAWEYVQASRIESISYGANPGLQRGPNGRIDFNYEWRCNSSSAFSDCGAFSDAFDDVPNDLWCGRHGDADEYSTQCGENAPTFWSHLRLTGILSQVADGNDWVTVAHHDFDHEFVRNGPASQLDSKNQMVLNSISDRPIEEVGRSYARSAFDPIRAISHDDDLGVGISAAVDDVGFEGVVSAVQHGDWVRFDDVWFGDASNPATEVTLRASGLRTGRFEVRIGGVFGDLVGRVDIAETGGLRDFETFTAELLTPVSGVKNVYLRAVRTTDSNAIGFVNWVQFGRPSIADLPEVAQATFNSNGWDFRDNRLNHPSQSALQFPRLRTFRNELGGEVTYTYGQSDPCRAGVAGVPVVSGTWANNHEDCFPQWDASPPGTVNDGFAVFNKWVVTRETRGDSFSNQPDVITSYNYDKAGWGFTDNPDSSNDTWNEFRGYNVVTVETVDANNAVLTSAEHRFYQGLHGENLPNTTATNVENIARANGVTFPDLYALRGRPYEVRQLTTANAEVSRTRTLYTNTPTTAEAARNSPRFVAPSSVITQIDGSNTTRVNTTYNEWGQVLSVSELGSTAASGDERTTVTRYYNPTTNSALGRWRGTFPCVSEVRSGTSTSVPSTNNTGGNTVVRWSHTYFDGATSHLCSRSVDEPVPTRFAVAHDGATSAGGWLVTKSTVDSRGRVETVTDPNNNTTTTEYDGNHGQVIAVTNPLNWEATTEYDQWRRPVLETDFQNRDTTTTYDAYSRVETIREPQDAFEGADTVAYTYRNDVYPNSVQTRVRIDGGSYTNSATFYDGFGRHLLTRSLAPNSGQNWANATQYDNVGRPIRSSGQYQIANNSVWVFAYPNWNTVESYLQTSYDQASRPTIVRTMGNGSEAHRTTTSYHGFRARTVDPNGVWTDTTIDGLGRNVEVKEQQNNLTTRYTYNAADDLLTVTAPDGLITTNTFDRAGRRLTSDDPDSGLWNYTYNANSLLTTQRDPSGTTLAFTYDALNRQTTRRLNSTTGTVLAQWNYATAEGNRGLLASSTSEGVTHDYTYDSWARVAHTDTTIPNETGNGNYTFRTSYSYYHNDDMRQIRLPDNTNSGTGETLTYGINTRTGLPTSLTSSTQGTVVASTSYNHAGQVTQRQYGPNGANGVAAFTYDNATQRLTASRGGTIANNSAWQDLEFSYDDNGNITRIFDDVNANQHQCFTYDNLDRLLRAYTDNTPACNGHTATGQGNYNDTYSYSSGGNIQSRSGLGAYHYEDDRHEHAVTRIDNGSTFAYDADGNLTNRNLAGQPNQTLAWDQEQRLQSVRIAGGETTEFLYDAEGARVRRQTGDTTTFYTPDGSEYTITTTPGTEPTPPPPNTGGGGGGGTPPSDNCYVQAQGGNVLVTWQDKDGTEVVRRNGNWVATAAGGTTTYVATVGTVDDDWVIRRRPGGVVVDETCVVYTPGTGGGDGGGGGTPPVTTTKFVHYYQHAGTTVGYNDNGTTSWLWNDQINSTSLTRTGNTNNIQRYTPWGELRTDANLTTDRHYTGQIADQSTGLAYYNARYYDPTIGRFISPDTHVTDPFDGQDYNRYSYVRNNPIRYNDPSGNLVFVPVLLVGALFVGAGAVVATNPDAVPNTGQLEENFRGNVSAVTTGLADLLNPPSPAAPPPVSTNTGRPAHQGYLDIGPSHTGCTGSGYLCPSAPTAAEAAPHPQLVGDSGLTTTGLVVHQSRSGAGRNEAHGNERQAASTTAKIEALERQLAELKRTQGSARDKRLIAQRIVNERRNMERTAKGDTDHRSRNSNLR